MDKGCGYTFLGRRNTNGQSKYAKMHINNHQKHANQNHSDTSTHHSQTGNYQNKNNNDK